MAPRAADSRSLTSGAGDEGLPAPLRMRVPAPAGGSAATHASPGVGRYSRYAYPSASGRSRVPGRRGLLVLALLVILAGAAMVGYPYASDYLNRLEQDKVQGVQQQAIAQAAPEDLSAYLEQAREYNERLLAGATYVIDPFDPEAPRATDAEYVANLNLAGDGVMGQVVIPRIGVDLPIYHGTEGDAMNKAVGHVVNTSLPVGGPSTHAVLAGHTGLPSAVIFDRLDQLEAGDLIVVEVLGEELGYRVTSTEVVLPTETGSLAVQAGRDLITLVTCTPYGINSHRLLVHAERCELPAGWEDGGAAVTAAAGAGGASGAASSAPGVSVPGGMAELLATPTAQGLLLGLGLSAGLLAVLSLAGALRRRAARPRGVHWAGARRRGR